MQDFNIVKQTEKQTSFRVEKLYGMFDLHDTNLTQEFVGQIEMPEKWNVGVIVGRSGTGKSTIANKLFEVFKTNYGTKAIIDEMPQNKTVEEITKTFTNVGFSSPPSWLKPYNVLSNGEKMRVDLAKAILEDKPLIVFDEFTSVVDRDVAKIASMVISKTVKQQNKQFIAVTCHYDIIDWLEPDWVFSTDEMKNIDSKKKGLNYQLKFTAENIIAGTCLSNITI